MAQNLITNGEGGLSVRNDINNNFTELYTFALSTNKFQPNPDYPADDVANVYIEGIGVGYKQTQYFGTFYNFNDFFVTGGQALVYNGTMFLPEAAGKWALISDDGEGGYAIIASASQTGGDYPWNVTWNEGLIVSKQPSARPVGAPLSVTAAEGTSIYAARVDHTHRLPTAAELGVAPIVSGKIPSGYLPSYVDDVIEARDFSSLPKIAFTFSNSSVANVNGEYVITAQPYNSFPTYAGSQGNTLRRRSLAGGTTKPGYWEIINTGGTQLLLSVFSASVPTGYWPSSTVIAYSDNAGQAGKIYVTHDTGKCYRWSGSTYIEISNTLELGATQIPDIYASIAGYISNTIFPSAGVGETTNGRNSYYYNDGNGSSYEVFWTGTQWKGIFAYNGDGSEYQESTATGNTTYPWQATGWTNSTEIHRFGTYNAALAPAPLAADGYSGIGTKAAREDHVHPLPTPADIGAAPASENASVADKAMELFDIPNDISALKIYDGETWFYEVKNPLTDPPPEFQDPTLYNNHLDKQKLFCEAVGAEPAITTLPVSKGGTGATTAAGALTALGAASTTHKSSHATGGTDALTPEDIGAAAEDHVHPLPTTLSTNLTATGSISLSGLPTYATNSAAVAGGLTVNRIYKTSTGELRIVI